MTKEELRAERDRLVAEVAALRELVTVIGSAGLPSPADGENEYRQYLRQSRNRLVDITIMTKGLMLYAGDPHFARIVLNTTRTLRGQFAKPLDYTPESAAPAAVPEQRETAGATL